MQTKRFTTFEGVFTPCLLSILGVIMYLRLGWVVGSIGLVGALMIIVLANIITVTTVLSMSSVVSNIRMGPGGAYSIITKSLGVEAGGAIGVPLYISQAISTAFYITGFSECWLSVFPGHNMLLVSLIAWFVLLIISYASAKFAFKIQFVIMGLIGLSLVSIFLGQTNTPQEISFTPSFQMNTFWAVFAVFFPAVTGILAGASMSGELKDPRRSIPRGTIFAVGISFCIYVVLAFWFAKNVPADQLVSNNSIAIDIGRWKWLVIAGIMGATLSSAISMFVSSPRILLALGKHSILPFSAPFAKVNKRGEPTPAILLTALIALITLMFGSLDKIAGILTMFFLITYGMINLTVFLEQTIGIISFRPTFRVSRAVPFLGGVGCLVGMFLIDATFSLIAIFVIIVLYYVLIKREAQVYSPDIRSGTLVFMAERLAQMASRLPYYPKIWKPNLLVSVKNLERFSSVVPLVQSIVHPAGRVIVYTTFNRITGGPKQDAEESPRNKISQRLKEIVQPLRDEGIFVESTAVETADSLSGNVTVIQTLRDIFFPPNTFFYLLDESRDSDSKAQEVIEQAALEGLGIIVLNYHAKLGFAQEKIINLWIRKQSPNINLSILIALQLERNWHGYFRLIQVVANEDERKEAITYLNKLKDLMRLPLSVEVNVLVGDFNDALTQAPPADINIFGMQAKADINIIRHVMENVQTSVLFLRDSKHESALA